MNNRNRFSRRTFLRGAGAAGAVAVLMPAAAQAADRTRPAVRLLGKSRLDSSGIYFVSYDGLVNNNSFQQHGILTYGGYQYAAWYNANRNARIARRRLPHGHWETIELPHKLTVNDSHNVICLGVSPRDGRLHVAMDTHNSRVYYTKSEAGLVTVGGGRWAAELFEPIQRTLDGVELGGITYPRFLISPTEKLQFSYRTGGSGDGTLELAEYDGAWHKLGRWSSATGSYTANGATSTTRNMYIHGLVYGPGNRLHATFTWREGNTDVLCHPGGLANHDTGYVYSDDHGRTWRNESGREIGTTGQKLVSVDSPGHVVDPLSVDHALINQESLAVDSAGNPHTLISYVPGRFTQCVTDFVEQRREYGRVFHLTRKDNNGDWRKVEIPVPLDAFGRSRLVFDADDNAYAVLPFGRIVAASSASGWTDWEVLFDASELDVFGEVIVDEPRVASDGVLSILYQERSWGTTPSPVNAIDFQLGAAIPRRHEQ